MGQPWTRQGCGEAKKTLLLSKSLNAGVEMALEYSGGKDGPVPRPCDVLSWRQTGGGGWAVGQLSSCLKAFACLLG